jgi:hypothetical protein
MSVVYDGETPPDAEAWLAMDDAARLACIEEAHARRGWSVGDNARVHAAMHALVENRLAAGDEPVVAAHDRFRAASVDRHTTIHALASVVAAQLFDMTAESRPHRPEDDAAFADLDPAEWTAT